MIYNSKRECAILQVAHSENITEDVQWCIRETENCDFLVGSERQMYCDALIAAVRWGKKH